ncbi:glycosyltransferase family 2 protein [Massilia sp. H6]|uniref:glycosyltransferase family 2 protein n=1 Tax=Massilia sp. H6 TaxID=2970464 RepID=UPI00216A3120|nr:glycosyltransferase family 2 protein [Massilia sp. H6]UVW29932.1 glycosyltransferase [Massilia sp. H6]
MHTEPTFSIVTCTWNSAATLADTLASLQSQTCQDYEHIFVDGGSTDATLALIAAYPANKRVLRDIKGGISRAMNQGIAAARGDIVAHLHSDDYYAGPEVLAIVKHAFDEACLAGKPLDWVYGNILIRKDGELAPPYAMPAYSYRALVSGRSAIAHPAAFVRRAAFERVGLFDETLRYAMDIDLWLRLGATAQPAMIDRPLAVFRDHAGSVSSANRLQARQEEFRVRRRYMHKAPLAFGIYCLRYLKRLRALRVQGGSAVG